MLEGLLRFLVMESSYLWKEAFHAMACLKKSKKQNGEKYFPKSFQMCECIYLVFLES